MTTLHHQTLTLLPIQQSHIEPLVAATEGNHALWNFMFYGDLCDPQHMKLFADRAIELRDEGTDLPFTVLHSSGRIIGSTRIRDICPKHRKCEIGATWFSPSMQRTGANLVSKYLLLKHAFETLGMLRVQFKTDIRNDVSRKSLERLGAIQEGVLRQSAVMPDGVIRDTVIYSILSSEWLGVKAGIEQRLFRHDAKAVYEQLAVAA